MSVWSSGGGYVNTFFQSRILCSLQSQRLISPPRIAEERVKGKVMGRRTSIILLENSQAAVLLISQCESEYVTMV
jgi:hypothetical protein